MFLHGPYVGTYFLHASVRWVWEVKKSLEEEGCENEHILEGLIHTGTLLTEPWWDRKVIAMQVYVNYSKLCEY